MSGFRFEQIGSGHDLQYFSCGVDSLDRWLSKEALNAHRGGLSRTHVSVRDDDPDMQVVGYFSLAPTIVTEKVKGRGSRKDGYPSYLLCKLARHLDLRKTGHGEELIGRALLHTVQAADLAGGRFLVVDPAVRDLTEAESSKLRDFYRHYGFNDIEDSNRMYVPIDTIRASL